MPVIASRLRVGDQVLELSEKQFRPAYNKCQELGRPLQSLDELNQALLQAKLAPIPNIRQSAQMAA